MIAYIAVDQEAVTEPTSGEEQFDVGVFEVSVVGANISPDLDVL